MEEKPPHVPPPTPSTTIPADQISSKWLEKVSEVLRGLHKEEDDAKRGAAGGREGEKSSALPPKLKA